MLRTSMLWLLPLARRSGEDREGDVRAVSTWWEGRRRKSGERERTEEQLALEELLGQERADLGVSGTWLGAGSHSDSATVAP